MEFFMINTKEELFKKLEEAHKESLAILNGPPQESDHLYHYTNLESGLAILESTILRFSDIRYLNDPEEINEGLKILNRINEELFEKYFKLSPPFAYAMSFIVHTLNLTTSFDVNDSKLLEKAHEDFKKCGVNPTSFKFTKSSIFISCLSEYGDDLRQWIPYASNGQGMAIGFVGFKEGHDITADDSWIIKVCYKNIEDKEIYVRNIYERAYRVMGQMNHALIADYVDLIYRALLFDIIACKSENYEDEEEWRLIRVIPEEDTKEIVKYRTQDNIIKPYIDVKLNEYSVVKINLGPKAEETLNTHSLGRLLKHRGYMKAKIFKSDISYR
jgi:hypothetical protein